jgi:hypothetical protein
MDLIWNSRPGALYDFREPHTDADTVNAGCGLLRILRIRRLRGALHANKQHDTRHENQPRVIPVAGKSFSWHQHEFPQIWTSSFYHQSALLLLGHDSMLLMCTPTMTLPGAQHCPFTEEQKEFRIQVSGCPALCSGCPKGVCYASWHITRPTAHEHGKPKDSRREPRRGGASTYCGADVLADEGSTREFPVRVRDGATGRGVGANVGFAVKDRRERMPDQAALACLLLLQERTPPRQRPPWTTGDYDPLHCGVASHENSMRTGPASASSVTSVDFPSSLQNVHVSVCATVLR